MFGIGAPKIIKLDGVATTGLTLDIRPPEGVEWLIPYGGGWHDDSSARNINWIWTQDDSSTTVAVSLYPVSTVAYLIMVDLFYMPGLVDHHSNYPVKLTHQVYVTMEVNALNAGKAIHFFAYAIERPENFKLLLEEYKARAMGYELPIQSKE